MFDPKPNSQTLNYHKCMAESEENWYLDLRSEMFIIEIGGLDHILEKALLVDTRVIFMEFKTNQVL